MEDEQTALQVEQKSNKTLIAVIGGIIIAIVVFVMGLITVFVNPQRGQTCTGKDPIAGTEISGYKDPNGKCKTLDGKELQ